MRGALLAATVIISFAFLSSTAYAGVGLSPASVEFKNMLRGGYSELYLTVSNPTTEDTTVTVGAEGELKDWLYVEPSAFNMSGVSYKVVKVIARPPDSVPNGYYRGRVLVVSKPILPPEMAGGSTISVASVVSADASVEISDLQMVRYNVEGVNVPDTEECRPILIYENLRNTGNVNVTPKFNVEISGKTSGTVVQTYDYASDAILPTQKSNVLLRVPYSIGQFKCIPVGRYSAQIKAYAGDSVMDTSNLDFTIYERGALTVAGEIIELNAPRNVTLGEVVKINALFKNTGQIAVSAKLKAEIYEGGRLVDTVSSDQKEVAAGGTDTLTAYFTPRTGGTHRVLASAVFEEKSSNTAEAAVEVFWPQIYWIAVGAALVVSAAGILLFRKKGRKGKK
ncbi:MAG: hypothetical protein QXD77_02500 [Candidatus Aenigmatarchaeota archaeon]